MARKHHDARQVPEEGGEHLDRVVVEVVGGLVEEQARRPRRHDRRQREPGPLAARERADVPQGIEVVEPEPCSRQGRATVGVPGIVRERLLERSRVRRVAVRGAHRPGEPFDVGDRGSQRRQGEGEDVGDRGAVTEGRLLPEQHEVGRSLDGPGEPCPAGQPAGDGAEQRRLPDPVLPNQPDPATRLGHQVDAGQDGTVGVGDREPADDERGEGGGGSGHADGLRDQEGLAGLEAHWCAAADASRVSPGST